MTDTPKEEPKKNFGSKFSKLFKLPAFDTGAMKAVYRRNLEAAKNAAGKAGKAMLDSAHAEVKRQAAKLRGAVARTARSAREFVSAMTFSKKLAKHAQASKATIDDGVANVRELATKMTKTGENVFDLVSRRVSEGYDEVKAYTKGRGKKDAAIAEAETEKDAA